MTPARQDLEHVHAWLEERGFDELATCIARADLEMARLESQRAALESVVAALALRIDELCGRLASVERELVTLRELAARHAEAIGAEREARAEVERLKRLDMDWALAYERETARLKLKAEKLDNEVERLREALREIVDNARLENGVGVIVPAMAIRYAANLLAGKAR